MLTSVEMQMKNSTLIKILILGILILSLGACSSKEDSESTQSSSGVSCTVSGTVTSGDINAAYSAVTISNITVYSSGSSTGNYNLTLPNSNTITVGSSYVYSGSVSLTTGSSGGISTQVTVEDPSTEDVGYCTLSLGSSTSTGTGVISISASASSVVKGSSITLTASASSVSSPVFSFSQSSSYPSYVTINNFSNGYATVTSSVAQTVTVLVTMVSNSSGYASTSQSITLTFTESGTTSTGSLTCTIGHNNVTYYRGQNVFFYISTNTGEQLKLTAWNPGEAWDNGVGPSFPMYLPIYQGYSYFYGAYSYTGTKYVQVIAESVSRPGVFCNGGSYLQDSVYIY